MIEKKLEEIRQEHPYKTPGQPDTYLAYNEGWNDCIDRVKGVIADYMDDISSHGIWILVEERLPEHNVLVLVTVDGFYNEITCNDSVALGCRSVDGEWILDGYFYLDNPKVIAWMPLPEPYREES